MEETTSLWDCGEYITTANKLEVGHPPGAPLFMMVGRLFSAFASPENAAMMVNAVSALSSSFCILFLFWTLTMLVRKLALKDGALDTGKKIAIFGSAAVGALAYTFTDSFWFSAVEGEVYAMSSFFTALVFWAIFKWEIETEKHEEAIQKGLPTSFNPNRWLIFIAYMVGLSIGVHLLNLLAIPAIGFVIYFQKTKVVELKGVLLAGVISLLTLGVVQSVVIPKIPTLADFFERTFTNSFGMSFNTGFIVFMLVVITGLVIGIKYTSKKGMFLWNNIIVSLTMLLIGYSSFAMIVVRSNANTPLDENNPETLSSFVSYLNRDQYGSWPILYGQYWNSPAMNTGCKPENLEAPKAIYSKAYVAKLGHSYLSGVNTADKEKIQEIVSPLGIPLIIQVKDGAYSISTPQFKKYVKHKGEYVKPNLGLANELDDPLSYEVSFMNLFDFEVYKKQVATANEDLAAAGVQFKLKLDQEAKSEYVNNYAGKAGERKTMSEFNTFLPRMYRTGEGSKYMAWINYNSHTHDLSLPGDQRIGVPGNTKAEQHSYLLSLYNETGNTEYKNYADQLAKDGMYKPNFWNENVSYMFKYQIGWMYLRYFMWNFSGRQNDLQGYGLNGGGKMYLEGNWLTGVDFIDEQRLGSQDNLPAFISENSGYNRYYMLPLILGLIGFIFHVVKAPKDMVSVLLLFLLTGFAIVIYLNQKPMEPRERDYAYAASFYAFAVWIGIGVYALFDAARNFNWKNIGMIAAYSFGAGVFLYLAETVVGGEYPSHAWSYGVLYISAVGLGMYVLVGFLGDTLKNNVATSSLATVLGLVIPIVLCVQNWDDHDRSNRSTARDFAYNYLLSCDEKAEGGKGAIIFTNGDNDTFPLWYLQEVEEERTDVRVANMSLLGTDWHINQMKRQAYESEPLPITMNEFSYRNGTRDYIILQESDAKKYKSGAKWVQINKTSQDILGSVNKMTVNELKLAYGELVRLKKAAEIGAKYKSNDVAAKSMPISVVNAIDGAKLDSTDMLMVDSFYGYIMSESGKLNAATDEAQKKQLAENLAKVKESAFGQISQEIDGNLSKWPKVSYSLKEAMAFMLNDANMASADKFNTCQEEAFLDFKSIYITVDKEAALKNGIITEDQMSKVKDTLTWDISGGVIYKSDLAVLDMFSNYKWDRPIYFASQQGLQANSNIMKYLQSEGLAFKFCPIDFGPKGGVNIDKMYNLMMDKENGFKWGNMNAPGVLVDYYTLRQVRNLRVQIMLFTDKLIEMGENQKAIDVLDRTFEVMPIEDSKVPEDDICYYLCANYFDAGATEKGNALAQKLAQIKLDEISYYLSQNEYFFESMASEFGRAMNLVEMLRSNTDQKAMMEFSYSFNSVYQGYGNKKNELYNQAVQGSITPDQYDQDDKALDAAFVSQLQDAAAANDLYKANGDQTSFENIGFLENTNYAEVMAKAKERFLATQMKNVDMYLDPQKFPRDLVILWNCSLLLQK